LQYDRAIFGGPRHRAGMIEREGERQDAHAADEPVARLDAGETAKRRGAADRAAGVAAGAAEHEAGRDRRAGAARRAAGEARGVPRVAGGRPGQIEAGAAQREFMRRELPHDDRAGVAQFLDGERVGLWHVVLHDLRVAGRRDPGGFVDVLEAERDAVQGAAVFTGVDLALGGAGFDARAVGEDANEAVQFAVELLDARETAVDEFDGREFALLDQLRRFGDRQIIRDHRSALRELDDMRRLGGDVAPARRPQAVEHLLQQRQDR